MSENIFLPGEIKPIFINQLIVYRMFNGERWLRMDDPDTDRVWDLMGVDEEHRKITREFYMKFDAIAEAGL